MKRIHVVSLFLFLLLICVVFVYLQKGPSVANETYVATETYVEKTLPETIDDVTLVEGYIKQHAKRLIPEQPPTGGSWSITQVAVNPESNTGSFIYKSGTRQGTAIFSFTRNGDYLALGIKKK